MSVIHRLGQPSLRRTARIAAASLIAAALTFAITSGTSQALEVLLDPADQTETPIPISAAKAESGPTTRVVPSSRGASRSPNPDLSTPDRFIAVVGEAAQDSQRTTGVPASVTVAQAILESSWGKSALSTKAFNFFGIKAQRGPGPAGVIKMNTWEVLGGANVTVNDAFRAYHNVFESVEDHGRFLRDNARYAAAFKAAEDAKEFARRIHSAGYATDPGYSDKLIRLMDKYNLYRFDLSPKG